MKENTPQKNTHLLRNISILMGSVCTVWASAAFLSGLAQVNWQVSELIRHYLVAIGLVQEFHTSVDFYTHIKGVEYIVAVAFLVGFPVFFSSLNKTTATDAIS